MTTMAKTLKLLRVAVPVMAIVLLAACGGAFWNPPISATTYDVSATAGTGGSISPSSAMVNAGGTTKFTVSSNSGYVLGGVTGCGGTLSGNTYTTGAINANCTVTASFSAFIWVGGSGAVAAKGVYGTEGVAAVTNVPGARYGATRWMDASGNLWLFGGTGYGSTGSSGLLNDLWKYSPSSGEWTWVNGSSTGGAKGIYGSQGVTAATNVPGARYFTVSWTDASGNLWLFGGYGFDSTGAGGYLNDLWQYSPSSGTWTWYGGSTTIGATGVYSTIGQPATSSVPGARENGVSWADAGGDLWLFGGTGYGPTGSSGPLNDLWKYSPSSGEWTWVSGSSTGNAKGIYGSQGVAAATNVPGGRLGAVSWTDASGNLWLFGGQGFDSTATANWLNDLWEYSLSSGEWTWVGGSSTGGAPAVYGTRGVAAVTNVPGGRAGAVSWIDASGNLWLFGGQVSTSDWSGDLWEYSPQSGEWTWVGGSSAVNDSGVYGTQGVAATANMPGARAAAVGWSDARGNLWLFGGLGDDSTGTRNDLNDLWKYSTQ